MKEKMLVDRNKIVKILLVFLFTNYMIVTVMLQNKFPFQFLRDALLLILFILTLAKKYILIDKNNICFLLLFLFLLLLGDLKASSLSSAIQETRRYLFPLFFLFTIDNKVNYITIKKMMSFILYSVFLLALWGMFQAFFLKDTFLIGLGYPTRYANEYGRIALNYSYYFGNLGIQRSTATFSSSNIFAAVLGVTLIWMIVNFEILKKIKFHIFCILVIFFAYLSTFSRANFLAMAITLIFVLLPYIPKKRSIIICIIVLTLLLIFFLVLYDCSIILNLWNWVKDSLRFRDSSSAGRGAIWKEAIKVVLQNPKGIGVGYTGENAYQNGSLITYPCENSYLCVAIDLGILGSLSYFCFLLYNIHLLNKNVKKLLFERNIYSYKLNRSAFAILVYFLIICFFSNHIKDMELVSYIYLFLAIGLNASKNSIVR